MNATTITCDVCGVEKRETNHWLIAVTSVSSAADNPGIAFGPLGAPVRDDPDFKIEHLCGESCALKHLSRWLDELKAASSNPK